MVSSINNIRMNFFVMGMVIIVVLNYRFLFWLVDFVFFGMECGKIYFGGFGFMGFENKIIYNCKNLFDM